MTPLNEAGHGAELLEPASCHLFRARLYTDQRMLLIFEWPSAPFF